MKKEKHQVQLLNSVYEKLNYVSEKLGMPKTQTINYLLNEWIESKKINYENK